MAARLCYGARTPAEYHLPVVRLFNQALLRAHSGMRSSQSRVRVWLSAQHFPLSIYPEYHAYLEHAQDNARARVLCQDRELLVSPLSPSIMGLCPDRHGGPYLSLALVYTFLVG